MLGLTYDADGNRIVWPTLLMVPILLYAMIYGMIFNLPLMFAALACNAWLLWDSLQDRTPDDTQPEPELEKADDAYYNYGTPLMSDAEYDKKRRENPSDGVGSPVIGGTKHATPMRSLSSAIDSEELSDFFCHVSATVGTADFIIEPKIDGLALNLTYANCQLVSAVTRGDGSEGKDVTEKVRWLVPETVKFDELEVRGEICLLKSQMAAINAGRNAIGKEPYATAQSAATATLMHEPSAVCKARKLMFIAYDVGYGKHDIAKNQARLVTVLKNLEFDTLEHTKAIKFEGMLKKCRAMFAKDFPFLTDGSVVKLNDFDLQEALGDTPQCPKWAKSWKGKE